MRKITHSLQYGLEGIDSILNSISKDLRINNALKFSMLLGMWEEIAGPKFKKISKAYTVITKKNSNILVVATSSSAVSNELSLFKNELLKKIFSITKKQDFKINEIIFNTKIWDEISLKNTIQDATTIEVFKKEPTEEELENIEVPVSIIESIQDSLTNQKFSTPELKNRMMKMITRDIKNQIWKKNNGFPFCSKCGIPVSYRKFNEEKILCPACKYSS